MKIWFQADADLNQEIIDGLIRLEPSIDFQSANESGLRDLPDLDVLLLAASMDRILITHDRRTMPRHFARIIEKQDSPGVFIIGQNVPIKTAIDALLLIWATFEHEEWRNLIVDVPF